MVGFQAPPTPQFRHESEEYHYWVFAFCCFILNVIKLNGCIEQTRWRRNESDDTGTLENPLNRITDDLFSTYKEGSTHGPLIYCVKVLLRVLKYLSISYYVNYSHARSKSIRVVDLYCIFQTILVAFFWQRVPTQVGRYVVWYILFDMFLNYGNVVFLGERVRNVERSIMLLFLSTFTLVFGFGALYRYDCRQLSVWDGLYGAVFSLGTMEFPDIADGCKPQLLSSVQMFGNLFLLLIAVGYFIGQLGAGDKK
jgi:hypothetical protein